MDQFQANFINEAKELLQDLEEALLKLEDDFEDIEQVEGVFRVMHTLKGSANMFGFERVGELTHDLETIYDQIRDGQKKLSEEILNASLRALDHIGNLIDNPGSDAEELLANQTELLGLVRNLAGVSNDSIGTDSDKVKVKKKAAYYVSIIPNQDFFLNGSNPLFLLEDLSELGSIKVIVDTSKVPSVVSIDPLNCYIGWEVLLVTEETEEEIKDVFMFVEDECSLVIDKIYNGDIFLDETFSEILNDDNLSFKELRKAIDLDKEEKKKVSTSSKKAENTIRINSDKVDELMNLVSQLVTTQASLSLLSENMELPELDEIAENVEKLSRQLRDNAFGMSLIPINTMLVRFKRMIRDISSSLNKDVDFVIEGGDTELDKTIIEKITDPLMHILRNSMDHGIESTDKRIAAGKPTKGTVIFKAYYSGAYVNIEVKDDGAGIDPERIRNKAIEKGVISADAVLTEQETYGLLFAAGFSTAEQVTDISGRGVGMDVVKQNIMALRGEIIVSSKLGQGSVFTLKLPLTLSIIDGLLVSVDNEKYVIPLGGIQKCYETYSSELKNNNNILLIDNEQIPFIDMRAEFHADSDAPEVQQTVVVNSGDRKVGLVIDSIVGEAQSVIKPLGELYKDQDIFSGSTILGDGSVSLVLDPNRIIQNYSNTETLN